MPLSAPWRSRPVYIIATTRDMQAEREYLLSRVFPALQAQLQEHHVHLEPIDLRARLEGLDPEQAQAQRHLLLQVCLDELERSRPFVIALLADRYGWVPPQHSLEAVVQEKGFLTETRGKSVLALEVEFGVLRSPEPRSRSFFYFRQPLPYPAQRDSSSGASGSLRAQYSDEYATDSDQQDRWHRLQQLKAEIEQKLPGQCRHYSASWDSAAARVVVPEALGKQVKLDLLPAVIAEAEQSAAPSAAARTTMQLQQFITQQARGFVGRAQTLRTLTEHAVSPTRAGAPGVLLTGKPGSGRSALFAQLHRQLVRRDDLVVLAHAAGISLTAGDVDAAVRSWLSQLDAQLGVAVADTEQPSSAHAEQRFSELVARAARKRRIVILIDGLDQLESTGGARQLAWLAEHRPDNGCLIVMTSPGQGSELLAERLQLRLLPLPPLEERDSAALAKGLFARYHRKPNQAALAVLLSKRTAQQAPASGNPLWLSLALEQLISLDLDDYHGTADRYRGTAEQRLQQLAVDEARALPATADELCRLGLQRAEQAHGQELTRAFAALLAVCPGGLRRHDLEPLIPRAARILVADSPVLEWGDLAFAALRRTLRAQLVCRGSERRWDFAHGLMRDVVQSELLSNPDCLRHLHSTIADHLERLVPGDPLRVQIMFHLIRADDGARAAHYYGEELTGDEKAAATRALADMIAAGSRQQPNPGLGWTLALLEQPWLPEPASAGLCRSFTLDLHDALPRTADLGARHALLHKAGATLAKLVQTAPPRTDWQHELAVTHLRLGDVLRALNDPDQALDCYAAGRQLLEQLVATEPAPTEWQRDLAACHQRLGDVLCARGELDEALASLGACGELVQSLADTDPGNRDWQRNWVVTQIKLGDVLRAQGELREALACFRTGLEIAQHEAEQDRTNAALQRDLVVCSLRMAQIHDRLGQVQQATDSRLLCRDTLRSMQSRGLHLDLQLAKLLRHLEAKKSDQ